MSLFKEAGLQTIKCERIECGYCLTNIHDWWSIIWNAGFRRFLTDLSQEDLPRFKQEHLEEVNDLSSDTGIRMDMDILFTIGRKKA